MTAMPMLPIEVKVMSEDEVATFGRTGEAGSAGFGALETARGLLPLIALDVDARVAGVIASIEVAQTFVNTTGVAIEATYMFPLPDRSQRSQSLPRRRAARQDRSAWRHGAR